MKIIPYGKQHINEDDIKSVVDVLNSDFLTQGPVVKEFEDEFAEYVGSKFAVAVNNATSGLHLSVLALGLEKGDRVITTPITFAASANCIRYAGGEVWFADIDPNTYLLDINSVKELIESKPKGFFKGIVPVDFAGLPLDMEEFKNLANTHDLWIIEDACHAPGGHFEDSKGIKQKCGNAKYADTGVFSFHPVKHIACGEGGMITTNSKQLYNKLMLLRSHGITKDHMEKNHGGWYYEMKDLGFNYRLTDIQCALGITQLARNDKGVERRNEIANKYKEAFKGKIKYQSLPTKSFNAHHLFIIELDRRKELYDFLREKNIFAQIHYIPVHTLPYYKRIGYEDANLINSENYYSKCISLPMFPTLTDKEQLFVIKLVLKFNSL
ncbi:UDP-4-amino-4,6-dideoxy-N-acetyl-beta-L-altrosamine transaminase [Flavobacteriaceae bacterium]|nr:UDP-4-amino-4,6-dideoxy-N-acetyl-beta-L-altrosamine transaminase [Flavobacteriaceae bacterium]